MSFQFISLKKSDKAPYKYTAIVKNKTTGKCRMQQIMNSIGI